MVAGSIAAAAQSTFYGGAVGAGSVFALLQSAGAAGIGLAGNLGLGVAGGAAGLGVGKGIIM